MAAALKSSSSTERCAHLQVTRSLLLRIQRPERLWRALAILGIILAATSTRTHLNRLHLISPGYRFRPGRLLKLAPKTVISISAFCSRYWVGVIFFGLAEGMFASPTLDALVNAAASFSAAIGQQLVFVQNEPAPAEFSEKTIAYAKRKRPISRPYGRRCPN